MSPRRKLPIGIQTFRKIREEGCYYVDKTAYVRRLVDDGAHYFLSRPRRFGKSLLLDTMKELFEGNEALFEGLEVHTGWDWSVRHPVLRLDFGGGSYEEPGLLPKETMAQLDAIERRAGVEGPATTPRPPASGISSKRCTNAPASGWWCWWTSTTSPFWTRWARRRSPAPTAASCGGSTRPSSRAMPT